MGSGLPFGLRFAIVQNSCNDSGRAFSLPRRVWHLSYRFCLKPSANGGTKVRLSSIFGDLPKNV